MKQGKIVIWYARQIVKMFFLMWFVSHHEQQKIAIQSCKVLGGKSKYWYITAISPKPKFSFTEFVEIHTKLHEKQNSQ